MEESELAYKDLKMFFNQEIDKLKKKNKKDYDNQQKKFNETCLEYDTTIEQLQNQSDEDR